MPSNIIPNDESKCTIELKYKNRTTQFSIVLGQLSDKVDIPFSIYELHFVVSSMRLNEQKSINDASIRLIYIDSNVDESEFIWLNPNLDMLSEEYQVNGNEAFRIGHYKVALWYYTKSIGFALGYDYNTNLCTLYTNVAACQLRLNNFEKCIRSCTLALQFDKKCSKALMRRGISLYHIDNKHEAWEDLRMLDKGQMSKDVKDIFEICAEYVRSEKEKLAFNLKKYFK